MRITLNKNRRDASNIDEILRIFIVENENKYRQVLRQNNLTLLKSQFELIFISFVCYIS